MSVVSTEDPQPPPYEEGVERKHERRADEPPPLADDGEDEVRVVLGQEVQARLRRAVAAAGLLARADRDPRVVLLVARVPRVIRGMQERRETLHLVVVEHGDPGRR